MTSANAIEGLVVDPVLLAAWRAAGGGEVRGIAGAVTGDLGAVVVAAEEPAAEAVLETAVERLAAALGVRAVEVLPVGGSGLAELVRDWTYQAGQGSGRGVRVTIRTADAGTSSGNSPVRVLVRAIDSSARELAFRLASPQEPSLPALRALLGGREVSVQDEESLP